MNYQYVGQIKVAKQTSREDKSSHVVTYSCEVTIQFEDYDKNGELVLDTQHINYHISELEGFKKNINKFISVPFIFLVAKSGSYIFPNEDMPYTIFEQNPLFKTNILKDKKIS